jgi:mRNA-degrading endonuclease RelE of RelBE toxin-antitoxin system
MKLKVQPSFERDVKKSPKHIILQLNVLLDLIIAAESLGDIPDLKKLSGHKNAYRIRINDYRLGFVLEDKVIVLMRLLSRKDVYRHFP